MPRTSRLVVPGESTVYHVMSRTALPGLPIKDAEKDYFIKLLKHLSKVYFAEVLGVCCMSNTFML